MSTLEQLQDLMIGEYKLSREQLSPEVPLGSLGIDSLGIIELMFHIEDRFDIVLANDNTTDFVTIDDVVHYIDKLVAAKSMSQAATGVPAAG
jgi:acyl carrier protein